MGKRVMGILLTILGILGLILAAVNFVQRGDGEHNMKLIAAYGILGVVFFTAGLGLMRNVKDVLNKNEHVS